MDGEVPVQVFTNVVPAELVFSLSLEGFCVAEFPSVTLDSDTLSIVIDSELHTSNGTSQRSVCVMA